jgi:hypothetical protein
MNDTTGKALIEHWEWAADKGVMNKNTAIALKAASLQVLSILDDWENVDIATMNVDDVLNRFQNLRSREFKPETLNVYKRRFRQSVKAFLEYQRNPSGWKPPAQNRPGQKPKNGGKQKSKEVLSGQPITHRNVSPSVSEEGLVVFPFPLRENLVVYLHLPPDLKATEVKRLTAFMTTLTVDFEFNQ